MTKKQGLNRAPSVVKRWQVGDVTISRIVESQTFFDIPAMFPRATHEDVAALPWLAPHFVTSDGQGILSIHALVIETPSKRIIVDTCVGNDKNLGAMAGYANLQTSFLVDLEAAGFAPDSFDVVLCTHMHMDHVGWNTMLVNGHWIPTFPNARYLLSRTEMAYWSAPSRPGTDSAFDKVQRLSFADSLQPVVDAELVDLVDDNHRVCEELELVPTPGHSPGHVSVRISSRGCQAVITGDVAHHPCQLAHPEWGIPHIDFDGEQATTTRRQLFSELADRPVLLIGTHWAGATAGQVKRTDTAFRLEC